MFKHYLKTAVRMLMRKKLYTAINIFGLAIGLSLCLATISHFSHETGFEDFHQHKDSMYRVECDFARADSQFSSATVMPPLGAALTSAIPEVERSAVFRVRQITSITIDNFRQRVINEYEGAGYAHGNKLIFASPEYFEVFTFPLVQGNPATALSEPFSALISEDAAAEYFPNENPVGQVMEINDRYTCKVTGILKNIPQNTQLYCHFVISYATLEATGAEMQSWDRFDGDYTYLLLRDQADPEAVQSKIPAVAGRYFTPETAGDYHFRLKPLKDIFFGVYGSPNRGELYPAGEISVIYNFLAVAVFILIVAIANFVNLSTAQAADRMKEVGMRKVFGAYRQHLIKQYLGESIVIVFISMLLAVLIFEIFKFNIDDLMPRRMFANIYDNPLFLMSSLGLIVVVGVLAGFYPALYISRFQPITVLQGKSRMKSSRSTLRKGLVVFQFAVAAVFIFMTTIIIRQTNMITSIDPGFVTENMMVLDFDGDDAAEHCRLVQNEITNRIPVAASSAVNSPPGREKYSFYGFYLDEERKREDRVVTKAFMTDYGFLETFGLNLVEGRNFSPGIASDVEHAVIVNESLAETLGGDNPVGSRLYGSGDKFYEVIGVVEDFHGTPLNFGYKSEIVITMRPEQTTSLVLRLPSDNISGSVTAVREAWERVIPGYEFDYSFLDAEIDNSYSESRSQSKMFLAFAIFAIAIACLGVLGLVSYTSEQRTKEIGIRKVLGASLTSIVTLLSREFVWLILIANVLALPVAYLIMQDFLKWFPYQVGIGIGTYAFVIGTVLLFALVTAGLQSAKAGVANPVEALKCE